LSPPTEKGAARAEAQRARILDAAQQCFIAEGFHAATIATIAQGARMSAGLIYRYFENKDAVVLAIIDRELARARAKIAALHGAFDLAEGMTQTYRELSSGSPEGANAALFLEMSAEATRSPEVAQAVAHADRLTRGDLQAFLQRPRPDGGGLSEEAAASRALLMQILFSGIAVRAARDRAIDPADLRRALALVTERFA
jgi:AcrR family transcriptional regulator